MFEPQGCGLLILVLLVVVFPFYYKQVVLEKNELREEKASLRSDSENLNV